MGRPSSFTPELATLICDRIASGETLRQVCRDEGMPSQSMVFRWLQADEPFREQYARAREALMDHFADELIDIAEDGSNDWTERETKAGRIEVVDREVIERSRLRIEARKWLMGKCAPKKYGEKLQLAGDGGGAIRSETSLKLADLTGEERNALRAIIARRAGEPDGSPPGA